MKTDLTPLALGRRATFIRGAALAAALIVASGCASDSSANGGGEAKEASVTDPSVVATEATAPGQAFDASTVHSIAVSFDDDAYAELLATYRDSGDKAWIAADVTIDGVMYRDAGMRLKGNSSLRSLSSNGRRSNTTTTTVEPNELGEAIDEIGDGSSPPETLPWLIRLNKYVDGQTHQGYEDFVVRSNTSETSLNEAVSQELLAAAGLASQLPAATLFSVNGSEPTLRLVLEHPDDDEWYERVFNTDGALYKAESTGDWSYRGDDPASYEDVFDQEGGSDITDLTPLIEFLEFINESDDDTFATELPTRLDTDAFATYLAMMDLLGNFDDIDGPGNNSYVWWDAQTEQITIVAWDMNLTLGTAMGAGSMGAGGAGPGGMGAGGMRPGGPRPDAMGAGNTRPDGSGPPAMGAFGRSNPLVQRFLENEEYSALVEQRSEQLSSELIDSGLAGEVISRWEAVLLAEASDVVSGDTVNREANSIRSFLGIEEVQR